MFAFRADAEMVSFLTQMPNASDFIRRAIQRSLEEPCPVCEGRGVVAPGFRAETERLGGHIQLRRCDCCAAEYPAACEARGTDVLAGADRLRAVLNSRRGQNLCAACFERAPACTRCARDWLQHDVGDFVAHFQIERCGRALIAVSSTSLRRSAPRNGKPKTSGKRSRR